MIRKTAVAVGIGAVVLVGAAGTAVAAESNATTPTPATLTADHHRASRVFRGEYAQWTTFDQKTNTSTVHDAIRGSVTAVSPSSITVKAGNGTAQTYAVGTDTKVHTKGGANANPAAIGQVKVGDRAVVVGTGQGTFTATHVLDRGAPAPPAQ